MSAKWKARRDKNPGVDAELPRVVRVPVHGGMPGADIDADEISLQDIWRVISRYRWLVLGTLLLATLLSGLAALLMTPLYRAEVLLAPVTDQDAGNRYLSPFKDFGNIAALAGINLNRHGSKDESIATLKSRKFTEQFIQDHKLVTLLFPDLWDEKQQRWKISDDADIPTLQDAYERFNKHIRSVREDRRTGLVTLSIEWRDPEQAAGWANQLVSRVNATLRQQAVESSRQAISYLQKQLDRTSAVELQQVLHRLIEVEMKKTILANINKEFAFKVIDPATVPDEPFRPRIPLMVSLSAVLGLMLGTILALVVNAVRGEVASAGDVDPG